MVAILKNKMATKPKEKKNGINGILTPRHLIYPKNTKNKSVAKILAMAKKPTYGPRLYGLMASTEPSLQRAINTDAGQQTT